MGERGDQSGEGREADHEGLLDYSRNFGLYSEKTGSHRRILTREIEIFLVYKPKKKSLSGDPMKRTLCALKDRFLNNNPMLNPIRIFIGPFLITSLSSSCWQNIKVQLRKQFLKELK